MTAATHATQISQQRAMWLLILSASAVLMITMGIRQSSGLFISPFNSSTHLGIAAISFALAIGQFVWGAVQPVFGAIADRYGAYRVLVIGAILLFIGFATTPFVSREFAFLVTMGICMSAGAGAGSFSILMAAAAQRLPAEKRAFASGFINAGGSFGQFVFAPLIQALIGTYGWVVAMFSMACASLLTLPIGLPLVSPKKETHTNDNLSSNTSATTHTESVCSTILSSLRNPSYLALHAGFFTCGFHIAFLVTHLPGEVQLCGLPASVSAGALAMIGLFNIGGSIIAGTLGTHYRMKFILAGMYGSRAIVILLYLLAPKTTEIFYIFSAALGFTWLATVPPTAGLVGKLFGTKNLGTLFGLTLVSHQIGGFLGAWLGGLALLKFGNFQWMWYADVVLALLAAIVNLPIREQKVVSVKMAG
jgi:MFS family permease